ncbi:helix-turn-helix domain-containing protein [Bacillus rubiinfantis]|uniref:helix-turn-helix domain-containing protein n=1 Tax=Bacillus rubiinfantis TaxID=1499680 RepID=UPI0005A8A869|nr:helix-turn-helix domain-containing protein [Bacillus rubiinfantis]
MDQFKKIILVCLKRINQERTVYSVFHLLNGKKSSQTIQDAHLFSLKKYFGILESLPRESFDIIIRQLIEEGLIYSCREQYYFPTELGEAALQQPNTLDELNGWKYQRVTFLFWERLSLLIQVASNLVYNETNYLPIQKNQDVHRWIKILLKTSLVTKTEIGTILYQELMACFDEKQEIDPSPLVFRLTGYQQIGLTTMQTAKKLMLDRIDYELYFTNIIHYILRKICENSGRFPLLSFALEGLMAQSELTQSSSTTKNLLHHGYSPETIATMRNLKLSTIHDHLVEIALHHDDFSIDSYVDQSLQQEIIQIAKSMSSRQLKVIKEKVAQASYFQIRLVLAKFGGLL